MAYEHLTFWREPDATDRHKRKNPGARAPEPSDPCEHGTRLGQALARAKERANEDRPGYDDRLLLKVNLQEGVRPPDLGAVPGVEVVSEEGSTVILAFMTADGLEETERRLATLARDGVVKRRDLFYAVQGYDHWTPADRTGPALAAEGWPRREPFVLDVELWPEELPHRRQAMLESFTTELNDTGIEVLDSLRMPSLVLLRVRCSEDQAHGSLLCHRDVRTVDLPPRTGLAIELLLKTADNFPDIESPSESAPRLGVLDTGITESHPLLGPLVGDARDYLKSANPEVGADGSRHGTFVAGLAAHYDVGEAIGQGRLIPSLHIVSGRVFDEGYGNQNRLVERAVEEAVRELNEEYGCRVFNLSYGDLNKVYDGRHIRGLGYTLDRLSRDLDVVFVVPTGNLREDALPDDPLGSYPEYLLADQARILDPAPALNAVCVGGLASHDASQQAQRYPNSVEDRPLAGPDQPFPLTRCGPSINNAIKPDLVEDAGNVALSRQARPRSHGMGTLSLNSEFAQGHPLREDIGTSYAAPRVAHHLARLEKHLPNNLSTLAMRALAGIHAAWPVATERLMDDQVRDTGQRQRALLNLVGYGRINTDHLYRSSDEHVVLLAEEKIRTDVCQFFSLPVPDELWEGPRRSRTVSIALAYSPEVRTTRLDYRKTQLSFTLVTAESLDEVQAAFRRDRQQGMSERNGNRWISNELRQKGTLQVSRWNFKGVPRRKKLYVVVTRQDKPWARSNPDEFEEYALAVSIDDRENKTANLYQAVRAVLQARADARVRART